MSVHRRVLFARVKTSAVAVATGIGAALAAGALATPAAAASADPWAAVRQCESGGNYSTNTGNGFYGGYQFTLQTWRGLGMSGLPSDAAPAVQDQAARRLAAQYGMKPWPVCGHRYGGPPPAGGGGAPHVPPHVQPHASVVSSSVHLPRRSTWVTVHLPRRSTWVTSSHRTPAHHAAAPGSHADPTPKPRWSGPAYPSHEHHYRGDPIYRSDRDERSHGRRSVTSTGGAIRVLSIRLVGQTRPDVRLYQLALDRVGYHLVVDGRFGRHTRLATMHFQAAHWLVVDGLAGPHTKAALQRALAAQH